MATVNPAPARRRKAAHRRTSAANSLALFIFAVLLVGAPLAFGAVDRISQVAVLAVFGLGVLVKPPSASPLGRWANRLVIASVFIVLLKEFAPSAWFGATAWRVTLQDLGLELPWTHNPEPARAFDALLAGAAAVVWFRWVRTLAAERENHAPLGWSMFVAAVIVVAVSVATRGLDPQAIYGLRYTPGWTGFGPFPNRNHTADFLAMGFVLGCGCVVWAGASKRWISMVCGCGFLGLILYGLLATQSRGGLLAGMAGLACFLALVLIKTRSRRAVAVAVAAVLVAGALGVTLGGQVLDRFHSQEGGDVSNLTRLAIWKDAVGMWLDAPLFGHGLGTFGQLFGLYQKVQLENQVVLHPESSWLQWLVELGAVPVLLGALSLGFFTTQHLREAFTHQRGFFLRAGAFSAVAVLLVHAAFDVPGHRWGTVGFALAALALACPGRLERPSAAARGAAFVPLAVAGFWVLPFLGNWPAWSPFYLQRLLTDETSGGRVSLLELQRELPYFPLNAQLHQALGQRLVRIYGRKSPALWQQHFAIASRLVPAWWSLPADQARAVERIAPGLALGYWQQAVERGTLHREEIFRNAVRQTATLPLADTMWSRYVEAHPDLLLTYAQIVPEAQARYYFALWWSGRGLSGPLHDSEIEAFYQNATGWSSRTQFDEWMQRRADWRSRDHLRWARLLQKWGDQEKAFTLLAEFIPEPEFPRTASAVPRDQLEAKWRLAPQDAVNAQLLALLRYRAGEIEGSNAVILEVAKQDGAPPWFVEKAAHLLARARRYGEAVTLLLRGR